MPFDSCKMFLKFYDGFLETSAILYKCIVSVVL